MKNTSSVDPGHKHDHGGLNGLSDNDHPQYSLKVIGGGTTTTNSKGTISVTASLNRQTFVALATVNYVLATGNLISYVSSATPYLEYTFVNLATVNGVITVKPGTGNFIANLGVGINISNTSDGTGMPNLTIRLAF